MASTAHAVEVDGKFYNRINALLTYKHLCRYRQTIKDLVVALRCTKADSVDPSWPRIDGPGITVAPIPDPGSPLRSLFVFPVIIARIMRAIKSCDRYLLKLPEPAATVTGLLLLLSRRQYAVEVIGHAAQGILIAKKKMLFAMFYASLSEKLTKFLVKRAYCATYVSQYLERLYPTKHSERQWVFPSVELDDEMVGQPRSIEYFRERPFKVVAVGRMMPEKGYVDLVRALGLLAKQGCRNLQLHLIGDGIERKGIEAEVDELQIRKIVFFHGYVQKGPALYSLLDNSHLFVMPSLTEGMGRAMIDAMARGLPVIGSNVGGIPEYIDDVALFPPQTPEAIADKISSFMNDPQMLAQLSLRNYEFTKKFWRASIQSIQKDFWRHVEQYCK